jgi:hypothetical protein
MMNVKTLAPHYPSPSSLTATQLIPLHLLLHRPQRGGESLDPFFGPYISVLPRDFDSHPVTWSVEGGRQDDVDTRLLESLPPSAIMALREVCRKFRHDWTVVLHYLVPFLFSVVRRNNLISLTSPHHSKERYPGVIQNCTRYELKTIDITSADSTLRADFLWAWLNGLRVFYPRTISKYLTMCLLQSTHDAFTTK